MKRVFLLALTLMLIFSVSACSLLEDAASGTQNEDTEQMGTPAENSEGTKDLNEDDTLVNEGGKDDKDAVDGGMTADGNKAADSQTDSTTATGKTIKVSLYFASEGNSALKKENRDVQVIDGAILKACVQALIDGPAAKGLRRTIPEGTTIRGISIKDNVATVDFSGEFAKTNGLDEVTARLSVVNTLTEINGIERVRLRIEGEDMIGPSGLPLGAMSPALLDDDGKPVPGRNVSLTLYFSDSQAMYIVPEKRDVAVSNNDRLEKVIFIELMKGPAGKDSRGVIPKGTELLSVNTEKGLCTIDLSSEFVDNSPGGSASESMTINSIVNSLTELDYIDKVQFLIEGKKREVYTHLIFDEPFARNESIISK